MGNFHAHRFPIGEPKTFERYDLLRYAKPQIAGYVLRRCDDLNSQNARGRLKTPETHVFGKRSQSIALRDNAALHVGPSPYHAIDETFIIEMLQSTADCHETHAVSPSQFFLCRKLRTLVQQNALPTKRLSHTPILRLTRLCGRHR